MEYADLTWITEICKHYNYKYACWSFDGFFVCLFFFQHLSQFGRHAPVYSSCTSVSVLCVWQVSCLYLLFNGVLIFHCSACDRVQVLSSDCNVESERKSAHVLGWDRSFSQKRTKTTHLATNAMMSDGTALLPLTVYVSGLLRICRLTCNMEYTWLIPVAVVHVNTLFGMLSYTEYAVRCACKRCHCFEQFVTITADSLCSY